MREFLTPERVANKIRLLRSTFFGTLMLVEGSTDKIFYERFIDKEACKLEPTLGKLQAIKVLEILNTSSFNGVLAIVDADFDHIEVSSHKSSNLLLTDTHDLETMIINSPAFDKVMAEFGSEEKIKNFSRDVRTALLEVGMSVGYLLWVSQSDKLNLTFDNITFSNFIDDKTLQIDELKLIKTVKNKSQDFSLKDEEIQQRLINKKSDSHNPWQVCCGHHLVEILSLGLRKAIGTNKASDVEADILERSLRLAYEQAYFQDTQLYSDIEVWENNNKPFKVLQNH